MLKPETVGAVHTHTHTHKYVYKKMLEHIRQVTV